MEKKRGGERASSARCINLRKDLRYRKKERTPKAKNRRQYALTVPGKKNGYDMQKFELITRGENSIEA